MSAVATVVTEIIIELEKWNISLAESGKLLNFFSISWKMVQFPTCFFLYTYFPTFLLTPIHSFVYPPTRSLSYFIPLEKLLFVSMSSTLKQKLIVK
jgi:hypothetical protein